jgi:hypothetical protein
MSTRKDFLVAGTLAAAAIAPQSALAAPASAPMGPRPKQPALDFDLEAFNALLDGAQSHKHLFTAVEIERGLLFQAMRNTLNAYRDIGVEWSDVLPVAVLYHSTAVLLSFDDDVWNEYVHPVAAKLPKAGTMSKQIVAGRAGSGNPYLRDQGGDWDASIRSLVTDAQARFFVCNNAVHGIANFAAETLKRPAPEVYADLTRHLVPNAQLVPAGVWAVHAIQEQRFTLLQTTLALPD